MTADGIDSFREHVHAFGTVGRKIRTHEASSLPGFMLAIEPVGANVTFGAAGQYYESHNATQTCATEPHTCASAAAGGRGAGARGKGRGGAEGMPV